MTWLRSSKGMLTLSFLALLSLLVRSYVDTRFILVEDFGHLGTGFIVLWIFGYTAIAGGWVWALVAAASGNRRSLIALLVFSLITAVGFGAASLLTFVSFPIEIIIFGASLVAGGLASLSTFLCLKGAVSQVAD